jgi:hypothetical protein
MKISLSKISVSKTTFLFAFAVILALASVFTLQAQTTTFAQFVENGGGQDFVFTNNTSSASFNTISGGSPIFFFYQNITGLPPSLQGTQFAHLTVTTTTTTAASANAGNLTQPLNQTVTIAIVRDTPAPAGVGTGARTNLLTAVVTTNTSAPNITGGLNGNSATLSATTAPQNVVFSSDFIGFALTNQRNLGLSFSSVSPALNLGAGNFLQSFTAAATGTFASNPVPVYAPPTAASVAVSGRVLTESGYGLRKANVTLIEADGTRHDVTTGSFGSFEFLGITAGQTVVISINSKRYSYSPRVVTLEDSVTDLNFYPDN